MLGHVTIIDIHHLRHMMFFTMYRVLYAECAAHDAFDTCADCTTYILWLLL